MKGIILDRGEEYFTYLKKIFSAIDNAQNNYNWLITGHECYPQSEKYTELLSKEYCWVTGDELSQMIQKEDFQWIWGVLSGFSKNIRKDEILKYKFPQAEGYEGLWENPISIQHPLAEIEIVPWDSSMVILISKNDNIVDIFKKNIPLAEDLEEYNNKK